MTQTTVLGYSTSELIALMLDNGIHTSVDRFRSLAIALQSAALAQFVAVDGPAAQVAAEIVNSQVSIDPAISAFVDENFWDLLSDKEKSK